MDPTLCKGTLFTCRGAVTHQISDSWKQSVNREQSIAAQWNRSRKAKADSNSPGNSPGAAGAKYDPKAAAEDLDKQIKELEAGSYVNLRTSAQEYGSRLKEWSNEPLDPAMTEHGHKPVITSSFYRANGVF